MNAPLSRILEVATQNVFERFSVDAHALISSGAFVWAAPNALSITERIETIRNEDFDAFARAAQVNVINEPREHIVARLVRLVEIGAVQIPEGVPTHRAE